MLLRSQPTSEELQGDAVDPKVHTLLEQNRQCIGAPDESFASGAISSICGSQSFLVTCIIIFCFHGCHISASLSSSASPYHMTGKFSFIYYALA